MSATLDSPGRVAHRIGTESRAGWHSRKMRKGISQLPARIVMWLKASLKDWGVKERGASNLQGHRIDGKPIVSQT
jgi:hypothetical protein